jgi:hypothetical protein
MLPVSWHSEIKPHLSSFPGGYYITNMNQSITEGFLTEDDVDAALFDLLMLRFRLGLFDPIANQPYWNVSPEVVQSDASRNLSLLSSQQVCSKPHLYSDTHQP